MANYIPAFVIEKNDNVFINSITSIGAALLVPTPDGGAYIDGNFWAVPINFGTYSGFNFVPYNPSNPDENVAPTIDSYACVKISCTNSSDWFMILGTAAAYVTASGGGAALATTWPATSHSKALLPVCQTMNQTNASGLYVAVMSIPSFDVDPTTIQRYFPFGNLNGFALPAATANGYATTATLLTFLNTATVNTGTSASPVYTGGWAVVGTWTVSSDSLTLLCTQAAGPGTDVFCGNVIAIIPSA